jgi:hypothetical protein
LDVAGPGTLDAVGCFTEKKTSTEGNQPLVPSSVMLGVLKCRSKCLCYHYCISGVDEANVAYEVSSFLSLPDETPIFSSCDF